MRKFSILGAAVFALLVAASPVMARSPQILFIGSGSYDTDFMVVIRNKATHVFEVRVGSVTRYRACVGTVQVGRRVFSWSVGLRSNVVNTYSVRLAPGRHVLEMSAGCRSNALLVQRL